MGAGPLGLDTLLANLRTAETPVASTVHEPLGKPGGLRLFQVKELHLPAYVELVAHHLIAQGHSESKAIQMAIGIVKNWAAGHDGHGNRVHADVQAAAVKAVAQWEAAKAAAHGRGRVMTAEARAPMATASINDLPDSAFAYIEPGGSKDSSGKTTPRSLRHFPIHDAAHVRNALARASQSPFGAKAMPKIRAAAKKFGVEMGDEADGGRSLGGETERRFLGSNKRSSWLIDDYRLETRSADDGAHIYGYGAVYNRR